VEIAGKKHKFLFDTGAPVAISKELAAELNAGVIHRDKVVDATGARDSVSVVMLDSIKLGGLSFGQIPAITLFPDFYKCWGIDGVIGSNLMRNSIVCINSAKHIIIFTDQADKLALKPENSVPLVSNKSQQSDPIIKIKLKNKVILDLGFDTGDNSFLRMSEYLMNSITKAGVYETLAKGYGANTISGLGLQKNAEKYLIKIPVLSIGSAQFTNLITETNKGGIPAIGSKLLDYGIVTLDFIHGRFYFDATNAVNDLNEKQWPFQPTVMANKLIIGVVWDNSPNVVKPGEQIIAINDVDYSTINLCDILNNKAILAGKDEATITIKNEDGKVRKIQISKQ